MSSTISDIASAVLAQVDKELLAPPSTCLVCSAPSEKDYCDDPHCRMTLWKLRRGLERECLDLGGLR